MSSAALAQARVIFGRSEGSLLEIRSWRPGAGYASQRFFLRSESERMLSHVQRISARSDTYIGMAPRVPVPAGERQRGTIANVRECWCVWVDLDYDYGLDFAKALDPEPTLIIASGSPGHAHAVWALRRPLRPEDCKQANSRLALALGGDTGATDSTRVLRACGTRSFKTAPPAPILLIRAVARIYTAHELVGGLPDPRPKRTIRAPSPNVETAERLAPLVRAVQRAKRPANGQPGKRNEILYWAACRAVEDSLDPEPLVGAAIGVGLSEREAAATVRSASTR